MEMSGYSYTCSCGETFDSVALEVYGEEKYAAELMCANPKLCEKSVFEGGEVLLLPVVMEEPDDTDYVSANAPWKE